MDEENKTPLISYFIMSAGIFFTIFSAIRYYLLFPDLDRLIAYSVIGVLIIGLGWCHKSIAKLNDENMRQWQFLDTLDKRVYRGVNHV